MKKEDQAKQHERRLNLLYGINLPDVITLGGPHDRGGASSVGPQRQVIYCSGR